MKISDETLALCELSNDLLFHKIPQENYGYYVKGALEAGRLVAKKYLEEDIRELYKKNNITVTYCDKDNIHCGVRLRAEVSMGKTETTVSVYTKSLDEFASFSSFKGESPMTYETVLDMHLSHEFFHFLEYKQVGFVSEKLKPVETIKMPFFTRKAHINKCSEIAAHAFAKEMLGLSHLPNMYDYIYLINTSKMTRENFDKMIEAFEYK